MRFFSLSYASLALWLVQLLSTSSASPIETRADPGLVQLLSTGYAAQHCHPSTSSSPLFRDQALSNFYRAHGDPSEVLLYGVPYPLNADDNTTPTYYAPSSYNNVVPVDPPAGWDYRYYTSEDCTWDNTECSFRPDTGCWSHGVVKVAIRPVA